MNYHSNDWKLPHSKQKQKKFLSLKTKMTKTAKIILAILIAVIIGLIGYAIAIQDKVKAWNELIETQTRIQELEKIIEDAQFDYAIAETSKNECIESWNAQKEKAHDDAEKARLEIKEIQGFLMSR